MLGPVICGLSLRDSAMVILAFSLLCTLPPAYFSTLGPKTGMRQMVQARYSFGYVQGEGGRPGLFGFGPLCPDLSMLTNVSLMTDGGSSLYLSFSISRRSRLF